MATQLWQGRASKAVDSRVNDFNSSIRFDCRMIEQDIRGSLAHSAMLGKQGHHPGRGRRRDCAGAARYP